MSTLHDRKVSGRRYWLVAFLWFFPSSAAMAALLLASASMAQTDGGQVQLLNGTLGPDQFFYYRVPDLKTGDVLSVRASGESGDPQHRRLRALRAAWLAVNRSADMRRKVGA